MRLPRIWHFAAFFAYFSKVAYRLFFPHILAFSTALNILCSDFFAAATGKERSPKVCNVQTMKHTSQQN